MMMRFISFPWGRAGQTDQTITDNKPAPISHVTS